MNFRQVAGLMTAAFMLHLNVVASDAACGSHHAGARHAIGAVMDTRAMPMHADQAGVTGQTASENRSSDSGTPKLPCRTPTRANCCQALLTCSTVFIAIATPVFADDVTRVAVLRAVIDAPMSRIVAPDPPPPKV